jgi:hypothetical protein
MAKVRSDNNKLKSYAAISAVGVSFVLLAAFGMRGTETAKPCSQRYGVATQFSLQQSGGALASATDLQAGLGGRDWGVIENARVVPVQNGPAAVALHVELPKSLSPGAVSGLGFSWMQPSAEPAAAACLSYQVWVPPDFEYGAFGVLPGLFGGETDEAPKPLREIVKNSFGTHILWGTDGRLQVRVASADAVPLAVHHLHTDKSVAVLDRGRWIQLEQEVSLNTVGKADGLLRVWLDGNLKLETNVNWRGSLASVFRGVDVRAHFSSGGLDPSRGPKTTFLRLAPFDLRVL